MIRKLRNMDADGRDMIRGAGMAFLLRGLGAGLAFGFNVALARVLGAEGAGLYFTALSVVALATIVVRMGLDNAMLRLIAGHVAEGDWPRASGVYKLGMRAVAVLSLAVSIALVLTAPLLAQHLFAKPEVTLPLQVMSLAVLTFSMMMLSEACLKAIKRIRDAMLVSGVIYPLAGLVLIWPLAGQFGPAGACLAYVLGTGLAAVIGQIAWRRARHPATPDLSVGPELRQSAAPLWLMTVITNGVMPWAPLLLLGIWGTSEEAGIYGAANRMSLLVSFFLVAVNNVVAPRFAALYKQGNMEALKRTVQRASILILTLSSPMLILLLVANSWVMSLFGPEFAKGGTALAILAVGQAVSAAAGSVNLLLMMSGHEREARNTAICGVILMLACAVMLIPAWGLIGAATATSAGVICVNLCALWYVRARLGFLTLPVWPGGKAAQ